MLLIRSDMRLSTSHAITELTEKKKNAQRLAFMLIGERMYWKECKE